MRNLYVRVALFGAAACLFLWLALLPIQALERALAPQEVTPTEACGTDWDCCERNPDACREENPELYEMVHGEAS